MTVKRFLLALMLVGGALAASAREVRYVNPANYDASQEGSSKNYGSKVVDGTTPEKGFGTLARAERWLIDVPTGHVLVMPGTYATSNCGGRWRMCLQAGSLVESIEGPEKTVIMGTAGSPDEDGYGNGPNAIGCVRMGAGSVLRGFTLTGGRTQNLADSAYGYGGAVFAIPYKISGNALIEDCIITDNSSYGGICWGGKYVNCVIRGNKGKCAVVQEPDALVNCLVTDNSGTRATHLSYLSLNSTFGPFTQTVSSTYIPTAGFSKPAGPMENCIFICTADSVTSGVGIYPTNCFYITNPPHGQTGVNLTKFNSAAEMGLDENYRPTKDGAACGAGSNALYTARSTYGVTLDDVPRILNRNIDMGAYEYDWRTDFEAAIGGGVTLTNVSSAVTLDDDGRVAIPDGAEITGTMEAPAVRSSVYYRALASEGTLTGKFADGNTGAALDGLTLKSGETVRNFINQAEVPLVFTFGFSGDGYGSICDLTRKSAVRGLGITIR